MNRFLILSCLLISICLFAQFNKEDKEEEQRRQAEMKKHFQDAMDLFNSEDYAECEKLFSSFIRLYPESEYADDARFNLAISYYKSFKLDKAEQMLDDLLLRYTKGDKADKFRSLREELALSREDFNFALGITDPGNEQQTLNQAFDMIKQGNPDSAILLILENLDRWGGYLPHFYLGLAYEKKHNTRHPDCLVDYEAMAVDSYNKALSYRNGIEALFNLGRLYMKLDRKEEARKLFEKIKSRYPGSDIAGRVSDLLSVE